ncbi:hypothetical protein PM082_004481 [Marasmius tenuissimus]|nr:hypothetical protein PM082_004481 [Marasmius tenuissimus]
MVVANTKFVWNLFLRLTVVPAACRKLFPVHIAVLHPKIRDHLLLRDTRTLRPNHLVELFQKHEVNLVNWVYDINDSLFLQLAGSDLHEAAISFPSRPDIYKFMNHCPPTTVFQRLSDFSAPRNGRIGNIYLQCPSMWSCDNAFVEIRCFACSQVFVSTATAIRHFDQAMGYLESYKSGPNFLVVQKNLASVALILLSGQRLTGTKADDMDNDWTIFACMCCELAGAGKTFIGLWRASIKHFEDYGHGSLGRADLDGPDKLFRLATTIEINRYTETDTTRDWCCNHCHEYLDKNLTRVGIILHLKHEHLVADPKIPKDMFYLGV